VKWRQFIGWGLAVCGVVLVTVLVWPKGEPRYGGRYLSAWLKDCGEYHDEKDPRHIRAREAVRRIGTNGLPYMVRNINYKTPEWMVRVMGATRRIPEPWSSWCYSVVERRNPAALAGAGFWVLGPQAAPAVGALVAMLDNRDGDNPARALWHIGRVAIPSLLAVVTNRAAGVHQRAEAAVAIWGMGTNASDTVEVLAGCLGEDEEVAGAAAWALCNVTTNAGFVIEVLTNAVKTASPQLRAKILYSFYPLGEGGWPAVPTILTSFVDSDYEVRHAATNALNTILRGRH